MQISDGGRKVPKSKAKTDIDRVVGSGKSVVGGSGKVYDSPDSSIRKSVGRVDNPQNTTKGRVEPSLGGTPKSGGTSKKPKTKSKSRKPKKEKKKLLLEDLGKLPKGRYIKAIVGGIITSVVVGGVAYGYYYNQFRYPSQMVENIEESGLGAINKWIDAINTLDNSEIKSIIGSDSYLAKEVEYANGKGYKLDFIKKIVSTVSYKPKQVEALNKYGNVMVEKGTDRVVYTDSLVNGDGEEVELSYIDYAKVPLDGGKIRSLMKELDISVGDVDYSNKLVEVFCKYISSLDSLPTTTVERVPNLVKESVGYSMGKDEDIYLDKLLFSSEEFYDLLERFSAYAGGSGKENPDWVKWNKLSNEEKKKKEEPNKVIDTMEPTKEWVKWNESKDKDSKEEPVKYEPKKVISMVWCGSYYLLNELSNPIVAEVGDGSLENPAGLDTYIVTSVYIDGKRYPVGVRLVDYKVSQDALDYFESKDTRNRGYDIKSKVQYASYTFEVTNLSSETITIKDNSSLADKLANLSPRTGTVYGLQDSITLKPDEVGIIETWGNSTELNTKYLIWGSSFSRREDVVWFRVLMGNLEDKSENKGVYIHEKEIENAENGE